MPRAKQVLGLLEVNACARYTQGIDRSCVYNILAVVEAELPTSDGELEWD